MRIILLTMLATLLSGALALAGPMDRSDLFVADVYPSQVSAAEAVGRQIAAVIVEDESLPQVMAIHGNASPDAKAALARLLKEQSPQTRVQVLSGTPTRPAQQGVHVELMLSETSRLPDALGLDAPLMQGRITLIVSGLPQEVTKTARFVDKPWAADWSGFVNRQPKGRWIAGQSQSPAASAGEALQRAREAAARELLPLVRDRVNARSKGPYSSIRSIKVEQPWVEGQIEALLRREKYVADTFVQSFERPYGSVWQASILIDGSVSNIDEIARHCAAVARAQRGERAITWASMAGLVIVLLLLYFLVNTITRGYFLWRLRAATLLLAITGILVVLALG